LTDAPSGERVTDPRLKGDPLSDGRASGVFWNTDDADPESFLSGRINGTRMTLMIQINTDYLKRLHGFLGKDLAALIFDSRIKGTRMTRMIRKDCTDYWNTDDTDRRRGDWAKGRRGDKRIMNYIKKDYTDCRNTDEADPESLRF